MPTENDQHQRPDTFAYARLSHDATLELPSPRLGSTDST